MDTTRRSVLRMIAAGPVAAGFAWTEAEAQEAHQHISHRLRRLTQRKKLHLCKIINAYDPTIAPICKGKSNCPTQLQTGPSMQGLWTPVCRVLRGLSHL